MEISCAAQLITHTHRHTHAAVRWCPLHQKPRAVSITLWENEHRWDGGRPGKLRRMQVYFWSFWLGTPDESCCRSAATKSPISKSDGEFQHVTLTCKVHKSNSHVVLSHSFSQKQHGTLLLLSPCLAAPTLHENLFLSVLSLAKECNFLS